MILGNGAIAKVLTDKEDKLFFASGVSNSQETRESEYQLEKYFLMTQRRDLQLVYFSSLAIFYSDTRYVRHKREMEELVKTFPKYAIIRIGNITWPNDNPHTLINAFKNNPKLEVRDEYRYVIDQEEFLHWVNLIPRWSCEMNCPGTRMKVAEIIKKYV